LFKVPKYVFPICLLCFGYPTSQQMEREQNSRFPEKYILFKNQYHRLNGDDFEEMFHDTHAQVFRDREEVMGARNLGQLTYTRKFNADFSKEMNRSVRAILKRWTEE
jgi:hypothetical protein